MFEKSGFHCKNYIIQYRSKITFHNIINDPNIIFQYLGQVVVLVQRQEQGSYSVLGVGKVT